MLQLLVVGFPGNQFRGEIVPELDAIREKGLARIIDLVFVYKDEDGNVASVQISDLSDEERLKLGITAGALFGLREAGEGGIDAGAELGAGLALEGGVRLTDEDIEEIADEIPAGSSALLILFENLWSLPLKQAMLNANGQLIGNWIIQPEQLVDLAGAVHTERDVRQPV